jgi:transposase InsO family protein
VKEQRMPHVTLEGDLHGEYVVTQQHPDGTLVLEPDTSARAILRRMDARPATAEEFDAWATEHGPLLPRTAKARPAGKLESAVFAWIEGWYNRHRLHCTLGYRSPIDYENRALGQRIADLAASRLAHTSEMIKKKAA